MKIFFVGGNPVGRDFLLRFGQVETALANHLSKPVFQRVLYISVPYSRVGVRPEIMNIVGASECRRDKVVHFISSRVSPGNSIFLKYLPLESDGN